MDALKLSTRKINRMVNANPGVYLVTPRHPNAMRLFKAKRVGGILWVCSLGTGAWVEVLPGDVIEVRS